jgi:prolipoprotein diacylglyceryl transferase
LFPQLSDLLNSLAGSDLALPFSTYKFFLLAAFLASGIVVYLELVRKENLGEIPEKSSKETLLAMLMAIVFGMLGSKILSALEYLDEFRERPGAGFFIHNGQSFYGGLILAAAVIYFYARHKKVHLLYGLDVATPAIAIGYAVGRMGCHLAGDGCWGIESVAALPGWLSWLPQWTWSCTYPNNAINLGIPIPGCTGEYCHVLPNPVYPTSLYESVFSLLLFIFLWSLRKKINPRGSLFFLYILLSSAFRFFIEMIRINAKYSVFGIQLSQAQIISVILFFTGITGFLYFRAVFRPLKKDSVN